MKYAAALALVAFAFYACSIETKKHRAKEMAAALEELTAECRNAVERLDYDYAFKPCNGAAKAGVAFAKYSLGERVAFAQYSLGFMYYRGDGVPQDDVRAFMFLNLAAEQGYEGAAEATDILRKELTPEQIARADRKTTKLLKRVEWVEKAYTKAMKKQDAGG